MPWNGSGTFTRLYNWVTDAANGIKILASKQDDEINGLVTGLNNALCKDGQNSPTANINWNSKKITNLANGTLAGDAVNKSQLDAISTEWVQETSALSFGSTVSFKVTNTDKTATYHAGRRLKTTNTGGTVYSTIASSSYSPPDTSVFVQNDVGVLDSGLSAAFLGFSQTQPSTFTPRSSVLAVSSGIQAYGAGSNATVTLGSEERDFLSEFSANTFTAKYTGYYQVNFTSTATANGAGTANVAVSVTGSFSGSALGVTERRTAANGDIFSFSLSGILYLVKGNTLFAEVNNVGSAINLGTPNASMLSISRLE